MPIFTGAPVAIAANPPNVTQGLLVTFSRSILFPISACVLYTVLGDDDTDNLHVFKSTDGGNTWTLKNAAGEPTTQTECFFVELVGSVLQMVYSDGATQGWTYQEFNTGSDVWGSPDVSADTTIGPFDLQACRCPNGDWVGIYTDGNGGMNSIRRTGGAWQAKVNIFGPPGAGTYHTIPSWSVSDASSLVHFGYYLQHVGGADSFLHRTLDLTNAASIWDVIDPSVPQPCGRTVIESTRITIPTLSAAGAPGLWIGTPVAAPVWSFYTTAATVGGFVMYTAGLIWWVDTITGQVTENVWQASWDGTTVGAPVVYYDQLANPPAGGAVIAADRRFLHITVAALPVGGGYGVVVGMPYDPARDISSFFLDATGGAGCRGSAYRNKVY